MQKRYFFHILQILIIAVAVFSQLPINAQESTPIRIKNAAPKLYKQYKQALNLAHQKQWTKALKLLKKIEKKCPNCVEPKVQMGSIHYQKGEYSQAIGQFNKTFALDPGFNAKLHYTMGLAYWKNEQYQEALISINYFLKEGNPDSPLYKKAERKRKDVVFALHSQNHPHKNLHISPISAINSEGNESFPMLTADEQNLIFTARVNGREYLFKSRKLEGQWSTPTRLNIAENIIESGAHSISPNGKLIVFTSCSQRRGYGGCDLYISQLYNGKWSIPRNMGSKINSVAWEGHPSIGNNGQRLYFSSNRKGGLGQKDIWVSDKNDQGIWTTPVNLGSLVNTPNNEQAPFIHPDGESLYFASDGHPGMGGLDLYLTRILPNNKWSEPINLGYPINTRVEEGCMSVSLDGSKGYLVSDRKYKDQVLRGDYTGADIDIYQFEVFDEIAPLPVTFVRALVHNKQGVVIPQASVSLFELNEMKSLYSGETDEQGEILLVLPANKSYAFKIEKEGYLFHSEHFNPVPDRGILTPFEIEIVLLPILDDQISSMDLTENTVTLNNVFFESGKYNLQASSFYELNVLIEFLQKHPALRIRISGHTDNIGDANENKLLSEQRAKAVYSYLIDHSIRPDRLEYRGYGEERPIDDNTTIAGREKNRRTAFQIIR